MAIRIIVKERYVAIDYLRGFLTVLVVLHHALLWYTSDGYAAMIADLGKWAGFDMVVGFLDVFFMPLFFLISGLFALKSIEYMGIRSYLRRRLLRLGVPFVVGWLLLNIPAYYIIVSAYYQSMYGAPITVAAFFKYWGELGGGTAGPLWFLWVLLVFDCVIVLCYKIVPKICDRIRNSKRGWLTKPWWFVLGFSLLALICYLPMVRVGNNEFVHLFGPFTLQVSRVLLYLLFFVVGAIIGVFGLNRSVLGQGRKLTRRWWILLLVGVVTYQVMRQFYIWPTLSKQLGEWYVMYPISVLFVVVCVTVSLGLFGAFTHLTKKESRPMRCLSRNAYGIYIFHYVVVTAWQYVFSKISLRGASKGIIVFVLALICTWGLVWLLRRIPAVRRVIG